MKQQTECSEHITTSTARTTDYSGWNPKDVRSLIEQEKITTFTSGMCAGYAQANLVILPIIYTEKSEILSGLRSV